MSKNITSHLDLSVAYKFNKDKDLYICPTTSHGYYEYPKDIEEFHKNIYRTQKRIQKKNDFTEDGKVKPTFHKNREKICVNRIKAIQKYLNKNDECFDVGSGAGTFAIHLKKLVKNVEVLELDANLANECKRLGFKTYTKSFFEHKSNKKYDIVTSWHVLEHVEDIVDFMMRCKELSKKYVIIEVPTNRKTPTQFNPPREFDGHLHYFTVKSLTHLAKQCCLKVVEIGTDNAIQKPAILGVFKV